MSYNQNSITTEYIDPVIFVPNQRATFELDGTKLAYSTNMRLLDLGASSDGTNDYNRLLGTIATIRNIRLLDGKTELSALRSPAQYLAFMNQSRTNADNKSSASWLKRSDLGYEVDAVRLKLSKVYQTGTTNTTALGGGVKGYLDLRECFPILNAMPVIPTSMFPNLRIEIEWASNAGQQIFTKQTVAAGQSPAFAIHRPVLAVDVVEDERILMPLVRALKERGVRWNEIEHDRFNIAANPDVTAAANFNTVQNVPHASMAYVGKRVERLLLVKTLVDQAVTETADEVIGYGNSGSQALLKQTTQYRLNGKNIFPGFNGVSKPNQRLAIVSDEYGAQQAYPGSVIYKWSNANDVMDLNAPGSTDVFNTGKAYSGALSYDCVGIRARVADLQIQIGRTFDGDQGSATTPPAATNLALNVNCYAEVDVALAFRPDGSYRRVYL